MRISMPGPWSPLSHDRLNRPSWTVKWSLHVRLAWTPKFPLLGCNELYLRTDAVPGTYERAASVTLCRVGGIYGDVTDNLRRSARKGR